MAVKNLIIILAAFLVLTIEHTNAQTVSLPIEISHRGITITAKVGQREGTFLLDTGTSSTVITPHLSGLSAAELTSAVQGEASNVALGGNKRMSLASVRLTIGNVVFSNARIWISDLKGFDGIIGLDVLYQFQSFTVDLKSKTLTLVQ